MTQSGNGTATSTYAYDSADSRVTQTSGGVTTYYPNRYDAVSSATTTDNIYLPNGTLIASVDSTGISTTTHYIHGDNLGSTNVISDASGTPIQVLDYYPYGATRFASSTATTSEKHKYISQYADDSTSLSYLNARYYDSTRGQFLSEDPIFRDSPLHQNLANPQTLNSYSYASNNPIVGSDPSGLLTVSSAIGNVIGYLGGVGTGVLNTASNVGNGVLQAVYHPVSTYQNVSSAFSSFGSSVLNGASYAASNPRGAASTVGRGVSNSLGSMAASTVSTYNNIIAANTYSQGIGATYGAGVSSAPIVISAVAAYASGGTSVAATRTITTEGANFFEGTTYGGSAASKMYQGAGEFHSFPASVESFGSAGSVSSFSGGDGAMYQKLSIPGSYPSAGGAWSDGTFDFIKNSDNIITHRLFNPSQ